MIRLACIGLVLAGSTAHAEPREHLTGEWGGARETLSEHGVSIDAAYSAEAFAASHGNAALGHVDLAITVEPWSGGTLYVLGQNNHGTGINERIGSATSVSNLEAAPYTQLTEAFYEQKLFGGRLALRGGQQDANRDWGTPRYGGNLINNNFGMFPNVPLPSYPTTGLGVAARFEATTWLQVKAGVYEDDVAIAGAAATRHYGPHGRDEGTTSLGVWHQGGAADSDGFFVQHDEHLFLHPADDKDPTGLTVILRFAWARPDRSEIARYAGGSVAWHGLPARHDDTVALGVGYFTVGTGDEVFVELSYKLRLTKFASLQPDVQAYRRGDNAFLAGARMKLKL